MPRYNEQLRRLRTERGLKQSVIAQLLGTTQQYYSKYESGHRELPLRHVVTLAQFYNLSIDALLGLTGRQPAPDEPLPDMQENDLLRKFRQLLPTERQRVEAYIQAILDYPHR